MPRVLREAGIRVEAHSDHFGDRADDAEWLSEVGRQGWYVLTRDGRIRYKPNELAAVMTAGVGLFVLIGQVPHQQLAVNFVATLRRIRSFIQRHKRPFIAKVYRPSPGVGGRKEQSPGTVKRWLGYREWLERRRE